MKVWHALCLLLLVLVGTESLFGGKDRTSTMEVAQATLAERAAAGKQPGPAAKALPPDVKAANLTSWFSPDEAREVPDPDLTVEPSDTDAAYSDGNGDFESVAAPPPVSGTADPPEPASRLSHAGMAIRPAITSLIEGAS